MVRHYVKIFVYVFVLSAICEVQSHGVFIVYPFKEGDINHSKAKFSVRKFESEVRRESKMLNDTNIHLVYPTYDDIYIMTPAPIPKQESNEPFLDTIPMTESSTEIFSDFMTTTNTVDSYTQSGDVALGSMEETEDGITTAADTTVIDVMTTEIPIHIQKSPKPEPSLNDILYEEKDPKITFTSIEEKKDGTTSAGDIGATAIDVITTEIPVQIHKSPDPEPSLNDILYGESDPMKTLELKEDSEDGITTAGVIDAAAIDVMTTEIPIQIQKSSDPKRSLVDILYEETGPMKTLRKRMFEESKVSRKYPSGLKITNDLKIPTTISSRDAFKNWYRKTSRIKAVKYRKNWRL